MNPPVWTPSHKMGPMAPTPWLPMSCSLSTLLRTPSFACLLPLSLLAGPGLAQGGGNSNEATHIMPSQSQGLFSSLSFGVITTKDTGDPGELLIGDPGEATEAPGIWTTTRFGLPNMNHPDYSAVAMFGLLAPKIEFAAISTGNDFIPPVLPSGRLDFDSILRWFALTVSVANDAVGEPASHIKRLNNTGDTPGGELFTYYFSKSVGLPPAMINTVQSERSREEQGFPSSAPPAASGVDIDGLDWGLGTIPHDIAGNAATLFGVRDRFYFALTPDSVVALGGQAFAQGQPANTETIYRLEWLQQPPGSPVSHAWGEPMIEYGPQELELDQTTEVIEEIDAICVDEPHQRLVFSTRRIDTINRNQLHVSQRNGYISSQGVWIGQVVVPPRPLRDGNGILVTEQVGALENDDVTGTCGVDPEFLPGASKGVGLAIDTSPGGFELETPVGPFTSLGGSPLGVSITRATTPGLDEIIVSVTGLDSGDAGYGGRLLVYYKKIASGTGLSSPWLQLSQTLAPPGLKTSTMSIPGPGELGMEIGIQAVYFPYYLGSFNSFIKPSPRMSWVSTLAL